MSGEKLDEESVDVTHMWFMLLGSVTSTLAVLSVLPNYALAFILTRSKRRNAVQFSLRSCVCADIMIGGLFLVFVFPSWIRGDRIFGNVACSIGGILITWIGLVLPYSLVFMTFQRYSLTKRTCGWSLLKNRFRLLNVAIWIFAGLISALPFMESSNAYTYNPHVCYCALNERHRSMIYDHLGYLLPGFMLFLAGICLASVKTRKKDHRSQISHEYYTYDYHPTTQCYILSPKEGTFESRRVEAETRISLMYVAFVSSLLALGSYAFRTYGNWKEPGNCAIQAASFLLTFADGISRSLTIFVVRKAMQKTHKERESKRVKKLCSESSSKMSTRFSYGFMSDNIISRYRTPPNGRKPSGFTSFSLSRISARSMHRKNDRMYSFWSDTSCTPKSSISSWNDCTKWSQYDPEMTWQDKVTRTILDYKRQNYTINTVKMEPVLRKRRTRIKIRRRDEITWEKNCANCPESPYHTDYSSGENYYRYKGKSRPNLYSNNLSRDENHINLFGSDANRTQFHKVRGKGIRRNSRSPYNKERHIINKRNYTALYASRRHRVSKSTGRSNQRLMGHMQVPVLRAT